MDKPMDTLHDPAKENINMNLNSRFDGRRNGLFIICGLGFIAFGVFNFFSH